MDYSLGMSRKVGKYVQNVIVYMGNSSDGSLAFDIMKSWGNTLNALNPAGREVGEWKYGNMSVSKGGEDMIMGAKVDGSFVVRCESEVTPRYVCFEIKDAEQTGDYSVATLIDRAVSNAVGVSASNEGVFVVNAILIVHE